MREKKRRKMKERKRRSLRIVGLQRRLVIENN
jgi:hypothetical protein